MDDDRDFLSLLRGRWALSGKMGEVELQQAVEGGWVLGGRYMRLHFRSVTPADNPTADYEAVYHIGYNPEHQTYVMHLLDTTEVPLTCVVGRCQRQGNTLPFLFHYGETPFRNVFEWHPESGAWSFLQTLDEEGQTKVFASKRMTTTED